MKIFLLEMDTPNHETQIALVRAADEKAARERAAAELGRQDWLDPEWAICVAVPEDGPAAVIQILTVERS